MNRELISKPAAPAKRARWALPRWATPYIFILPACIVLVGFFLYPVTYSFYLSFFKYQWNAPNIPITFIGLDNYFDIPRNSELIASITWTASFTLAAVSIEFVVGMLMAFLLNAAGLGHMRGPIRGIVLVPMMIAPIVAGLMWRSLFNAEYGPVNHLLMSLGSPRIHWFTEATAAKATVVITDIWLASPFVILVLLSGLQGISEELYEAARIDGASSWQLFRNITLPLLRYPIIIVLSIRTMDGLRIFDQIASLTKGGPGTATTTVMFYNYQYAFQFYQMGRANAVSFAFLLVIALITSIYLVALRRSEDL